MNVNALRVFNVIREVSSMTRTKAYRVNEESEATKLLASKLALKLRSDIVAEAEAASVEVVEETKEETKSSKRKRS